MTSMDCFFFYSIVENILFAASQFFESCIVNAVPSIPGI
jgi:hypothetical protein